MKLVDQRPVQTLPGFEPRRGFQAVDVALDIEDRVDPGDALQRHDGDVVGQLPFDGLFLDAGQFEELCQSGEPDLTGAIEAI